MAKSVRTEIVIHAEVRAVWAVLVHAETFTGVLVPVLGGVLATVERDFQELNAALKARVERA